MVKYRADPFLYSNSVYGIVGIFVDDKAYAFTNRVAVLDYYGADDDVAVFKVKEVDRQQIQSLITGQEMVDTPVDSIISEISVVNEHQLLFEKDTQIYDVWLTRGIIFKFDDGHELSLEKEVWFSEDISIQRGYHLGENFTSTAEFAENWESPYRGECIRDCISFKA